MTHPYDREVEDEFQRAGMPGCAGLARSLREAQETNGRRPEPPKRLRFDALEDGDVDGGVKIGLGIGIAVLLVAYAVYMLLGA